MQTKSSNQQTLKSPVSLHGVGLHTGSHVTITMKPANPGYGIRFQRIDLPEQPVVKADADLVVDCRFIANPHWNLELRPLTGLDSQLVMRCLDLQMFKNF